MFTFRDVGERVERTTSFFIDPNEPKSAERSSLPPNLGITIFVAGVIHDKTGVLTVTNSDWFVLC